MRKTDQSIYNIVCASIKRHSMNIETWEKTKLWDEGNAEIKTLLSSQSSLDVGELPILYFWLNPENWSVFSTRAIYYSKDGHAEKVEVDNVEKYHFDVAAFKGLKESVHSIIVHTKEGSVHKFLYETGKPSMAAIYGIRTLLQVS